MEFRGSQTGPPFPTDALPEVLRALGNIGKERPDLIRGKSYYFVPLLRDNDPEIRGYTALLLGYLNAHEAEDDLEKLVNDSVGIEIYTAGRSEKQTIGKLASAALGKSNTSGFA